MLRTYKTPKGTELPLLNLRGREYLEVKYRLVWFREDHPEWAIETELLSVLEDSAYARATIKDDKGRVIATSHKFENRKGFPDFIEKAETGAIGRALALIGYGTQFCADELDEGDRVVDAPIDNRRQQAPQVQAQASAPRFNANESFDAPEASENAGVPKEAGDYRITFGKKYKGMKLSEIPRQELEGYMEWLEENASKKGLPLSEEARFLKVALGRFLNETKEAAKPAGNKGRATASAEKH